jgi:putative ABC transport system permease protein
MREDGSRDMSLSFFGRLAAGVTIAQAQAELKAEDQATQAQRSDRRNPSHALVLPYTRDHVELSSPAMAWLVRIAQLLTIALTLVVAVNLAILFYARTVTRLAEIAVRTVLGASRGRILSQLFIEALALSRVGAATGLGLAAIADVLHRRAAYARDWHSRRARRRTEAPSGECVR